MSIEAFLHFVQLSQARDLLLFSIRGPSKTQLDGSTWPGPWQAMGICMVFGASLLAVSLFNACMQPLGLFYVENALDLMWKTKFSAFGWIALVLVGVSIAVGFSIGLVGKTIDEQAGLGSMGRRMWVGLALLLPLFVALAHLTIKMADLLVSFLTRSIPGAFPLYPYLLLPAIIACTVGVAWLFAGLSIRRIVELAGRRIVEDKQQKRQVALLALCIYAFVFTGTWFAGDEVKNLRDPDGRFVSAELSVNTVVEATVVACASRAAYVTCALTLWPGDMHDLSYIGDWRADLETDRQADGRIHVLGSVAWRPQGSEARALPLVTLQPGVRQDVELTAPVAEACALEAASRGATGSTHIFFNVKGRLNHLRRVDRDLLRINPTNIDTWRREIRQFCRPADAPANTFAQ